MAVVFNGENVGIAFPATKFIEGPAGEFYIKVLDFYGKEIETKHLNNGEVYTLPTPPTDDKLIFQEWSSSQEIVDNQIVIDNNNVIIGAIGTPKSGLSEFDIVLTKTTGFDVTFKMDGTKDWGDGTSDDLTSHTYAEYGKYTIKCNGTTISANLFGNNNYYCVSARVNSVTTINSSAFYGCLSLTSVVIPNSVTTINSSAFQSCYSLTSVVIPKSVTTIDGSAFYNCYSLTSVVIPNSVTTIDGSTFYSCYALTSVVIPDSVTKINSYAFNRCYSLTSVVIPNSVTVINSSAFYRCYSLTSVVIPKSVTTINIYTFIECYSLTSVVIPNGVTTINSSAFQSCYSLTSVVIPKSVTTISNGAFQGCYSLVTYDFSTHRSVPTLSNTNVFSDINAIAKIIVPDALYDEWIVATNWVSYANYIYKASEVGL